MTTPHADDEPVTDTRTDARPDAADAPLDPAQRLAIALGTATPAPPADHDASSEE